MPAGAFSEGRVGYLTAPSFQRSPQGSEISQCAHSEIPGAQHAGCREPRLAEPPRSSGTQTQCPARSEWHLLLCLLPACFYRAAFFCHFWLGDNLCLNKQEGGFLGSSLSPLLFPPVFWLFLLSLFIPLGAQTLAELLRFQQGCSSRSHAITFHLQTERKSRCWVQESCLGLGTAFSVEM